MAGFSVKVINMKFDKFSDATPAKKQYLTFTFHSKMCKHHCWHDLRQHAMSMEEKLCTYHLVYDSQMILHRQQILILYARLNIVCCAEIQNQMNINV